MKDDRILLAHGGGGELMRKLLEEDIFPAVYGESMQKILDSAILDNAEGRLAFTTDSYVVKPLFFNGGDIGKLSVCGTVNDLAMVAARPLGISLAYIIEEGFPLATLGKIERSIYTTAQEAGVNIVTGDTKVVEKGSVDELFITTSGIGVIPPGREIHYDDITAGDAVIISGGIGEHGIAIMSQREGLQFDTEVASDVACLNGLVEEIFAVSDSIKFLRDPTRGGLAAALNELAQSSGVTIEIEEEAVPVKASVRGASEILGLDIFSIANEGKCVILCAFNDVEGVLRTLKKHPLGIEAACIGRVVSTDEGCVVLKTKVGGSRILEMPLGYELPRIC